MCELPLKHDYSNAVQMVTLIQKLIKVVEHRPRLDGLVDVVLQRLDNEGRPISGTLRTRKETQQVAWSTYAVGTRIMSRTIFEETKHARENV